MAAGIILFNGIRFPHHVVGAAISWAETNQATLHALFIRSKEEASEGYIFPSDLDEAENLNTTEETTHQYLQLIQTQIHLLKDTAHSKSIELQTEELVDPSLELLLGKTHHADIVFLDADWHQSGIMAALSFSIKGFVAQSSVPVKSIMDK